MVRHEVDQRFHPVRVHLPEQRLEFREPLLRLDRVVGADVEVILDRVGTAGEALEQIRVGGRLTRGRVIGRGSLLEHAGQPDVRESHPADRGERGVVDVVEFPHPVLRDGAFGRRV